MTCMQKFVETEPAALFGFAPDASFPIIHAEKGQISLTLKMDDSIGPSSDFTLQTFVSGERGMYGSRSLCSYIPRQRDGQMGVYNSARG